jgi:predicted transposase YbfD/YdcC
VVYGITSRTRAEADAERLLELARTHWPIEGRLRHVRDVTFQEDARRVRAGSAPQVLAGLRNALAHLLSGLGAKSLAAATRRRACHAGDAVKLIRT